MQEKEKKLIKGCSQHQFLSGNNYYRQRIKKKRFVEAISNIVVNCRTFLNYCESLILYCELS